MMERTKHKTRVTDIPFIRYREWMLDPNLIPQQTIKPRQESTSILRRFQKMFNQEGERESSIQEKMSTTSTLHMLVGHHSVRKNQMQIQQAGKVGVS